MSPFQLISRAACCVGLSVATLAASAADYPAQQEGSWVVKDFRFHSGEVLPQLRLNYTTLGSSTNEAVLILHGTTGSGVGMLTSAFAGELFGPGQVLDAKRYFIILPDAIGTGKSSKPSDGHHLIQLQRYQRYQLERRIGSLFHQFLRRLKFHQQK